MMVNGQKILMAEINFLCVHKNLREKKLAPVLIKEITRRVNCCNVWQAIYTAGVVIPTPITACMYYHRSLNPKKLVEVGFTSQPKNVPMARYVKMNKCPDTLKIPSLRPMKEADAPQVHKLLNDFLGDKKLNIQFSPEEIIHYLMPREGVMTTYVKEDETSGNLTDFFSFYCLPSSILKNEEHKMLWVAYSFYNVCTTVTITDLMSDALCIAKQKDYDVFNALDCNKNPEFL